MGARRTVHVPIRVRVTGVPDADAMDRLTDAVARRVGAAMLAARRELDRTDHPTTIEPDRGVREQHNPDREQDDDYALPSYRGGGNAVAIPVTPHRPWVVLRSVDFRSTVGDFLDAVERQRDEPLENRVLYTDLVDDERWVECWWVQTNNSIDLSAFNTMLSERAAQLARVGPKQVLATMISPFDAAWRELSNLDTTGAVGRLPPPGLRNAHRVDGNGRDAHLRHGAWVYFAFMVLPRIIAADYLRAGLPVSVELSLTAAALLVDERAFAHHFGVAWSRYADEFAGDLVTVDVLPLTVTKPIAAAAAFYLAAGTLPEVTVAGLAGQRFLILTARGAGPTSGSGAAGCRTVEQSSGSGRRDRRIQRTPAGGMAGAVPAGGPPADTGSGGTGEDGPDRPRTGRADSSHARPRSGRPALVAADALAAGRRTGRSA